MNFGRFLPGEFEIRTSVFPRFFFPRLLPPVLTPNLLDTFIFSPRTGPLMKRASQTLLWLVLALGSLVITYASAVYFEPGQRPPFLIEKLPLSNESLYLWVLRVHVVAAALALPGCLILVSGFVLKRWPRFHRWCGRIVGLDVLVALAPTGFYLAFFARGGIGSTLGFLLTGGIAVWAMLQAIRWARARRFARHRLYAFHVLGQLSVAVTSRAMLFALESSNLNPDLAYLLSLWIPVVGTFALVQYLGSPAQPQPGPRTPYEPVLHPISAAGRDASAA